MFDMSFMSSTFPGYNLFVSLFSGIHSSCNPDFPFDLPTQSGIFTSYVIISGNDFTSTMQVITITAGTNSSMMNISVTDDNIVEGDETFSMSLTVPSSLGPGITTGAITSATVAIIDTTGKH